MEWRIFFIGPMGVENSSEGSVDYSLHLPKLHNYIVSHLETRGYTQTNLEENISTQGNNINGVSLERGGDKITVLTPFNLHGPGDIPDEVFFAIDHSDLIIADLSGNKPAVTYELAFAHALGIETFLVGGPETRSFYMAHTNIINIDFNAETISAPKLGAQIDRWLNKKTKLFNSTNPLQKFYGAPLPDISAANGLAAGFYSNFALPILAGGEIVYRDGESEKISKLKGFIVLYPKNFASSIKEMEDSLEALLTSAFKKEEVTRGKPEKIFIRTPAGERTAFFLVRDYLIDIPRTMFSLKLSPRLKRYANDKSLKSDMEGVLINRFFASVKNYIDENPSIQEKSKFHLGSLDEIPSIIETGQSKTWDT